MLSTATQLAFAANVAGAAAGSSLSPVVVDVKDTNGSIATTDFSTVTLTLNGGAFMGNNSAVSTNAQSGVATFSNLSIPFSGTYTLTATDGSPA